MVCACNTKTEPKKCATVCDGNERKSDAHVKMILMKKGVNKAHAERLTCINLYEINVLGIYMDACSVLTSISSLSYNHL